MFVQIPGFPEYLVSCEGEVVCTSNGSWKVKKQSKHPKGYLITKVRGKPFRVHRLVAMAFVNNPDPGTKTQVNHKDGNKANNHTDNLEWVTPSENVQHAYDTNLCKRERNVGHRNGRSKLSDTQAAQLLALKAKTTQAQAAQMFGVAPSTVSEIWAGKKRKHLHKELTQ